MSNRKRYVYIPMGLLEAKVPRAGKPRQVWHPLAGPCERKRDAQARCDRAMARGTAIRGGTVKRVIDTKVTRAERGPARLAARFTAATLLALMLTGCGAAALGKANTNNDRLDKLEERMARCGCGAAPRGAEEPQR